MWNYQNKTRTKRKTALQKMFIHFLLMIYILSDNSFHCLSTIIGQTWTSYHLWFQSSSTNQSVMIGSTTQYLRSQSRNKIVIHVHYSNDHQHTLCSLFWDLLEENIFNWTHILCSNPWFHSKWVTWISYLCFFFWILMYQLYKLNIQTGLDSLIFGFVFSLGLLEEIKYSFQLWIWKIFQSLIG